MTRSTRLIAMSQLLKISVALLAHGEIVPKRGPTIACNWLSSGSAIPTLASAPLLTPNKSNAFLCSSPSNTRDSTYTCCVLI